MKECFMNRGQSIVAYAQSPELMQPCDRALNYPPGPSQITAMRCSTLGNVVPDAGLLQCLAVGTIIVSTIGLNGLGLFQRPSALSPNGLDAIDQEQQLRDVMPVGLGQNDVDRDALRIDEEVVFAAHLAAIGWVWSTFFRRARHVPTSCRQQPGRNRACRRHVICPTVRSAACAIPRPFARHAAAASRSCQSRIPFPAAAFPKEFQTVEQTECLSVRAYRPTACGRDASCAVA